MADTNVTVLRDVTPCSLIERGRRFGRTFCFSESFLRTVCTFVDLELQICHKFLLQNDLEQEGVALVLCWGRVGGRMPSTRQPAYVFYSSFWPPKSRLCTALGRCLFRILVTDHKTYRNDYSSTFQLNADTLAYINSPPPNTPFCFYTHSTIICSLLRGVCS